MTSQTVTVAMRVNPSSAKPGIGGRYPGGRAGDSLVVRVREAPHDGRATEAALRALAAALGVRRAQLRLRVGATSRDKLVEIDDADERVLRRFEELLEGTAG